MAWRAEQHKERGVHVLTEMHTANQFPLAPNAMGKLKYGSRADVKKVIDHYAAAHGLPMATTADEDRVRQDVAGIPFQTAATSQAR